MQNFRLYRAVYAKTHHDFHSDELSKVQGEYCVKLIYPSKFESYGREVHMWLHVHGFAPALYASYPPTPSNPASVPYGRPRGTPIYHYFQYLAPPTTGKPGWLTLFDYAKDYPEKAAEHKEAIKKTCDAIISLLETGSRGNNYVHGDLRPNNIMIYIDSFHDPMPNLDPDAAAEKYLWLYVIDFDWAGIAKEVFYPCHRNSAEVSFPGSNMGPIEVGHDREFVAQWMKTWAAPSHAPQVVKPGLNDRRRTITRDDTQSMKESMIAEKKRNAGKG